MRKLVFLFLLSVFLQIILVALVNIYANPFGYYGDKKIGKGKVFNARKAKLEFLRQKEKLPEVLVMGSSNSMRMSPGTIERLTGLKAYNYGVYWATAEDFLAIIKTLDSELDYHPKLVILCLDDWNLAEVPAPKDEVFKGVSKRLAYKPMMSRFLPDYSPWKLGWSRLKSSLSWEMLESSVAAIWGEGLVRGKPDISQEFYEDGTRIYYGNFKGENISELAESGDYNYEEAFKSYKQEMSTFPGFKLVEGHEVFTDFSDDRISYLDGFFKFTNNHGIKVIVNIMPVHPYYQNLIRSETNYDDRIDILKSTLNDFQERYSSIIQISDNHEIANFGGSSMHFFDELHVTSVNSDSMLTRIFREMPQNAL